MTNSNSAAEAAPIERPVGRDALIQRAKRLRTEIKQIFADAEHWNTHVRTRFEKLIDPDPDGELARMASGLDRMLAEQAARSGVAFFTRKIR